VTQIHLRHVASLNYHHVTNIHEMTDTELSVIDVTSDINPYTALGQVSNKSFACTMTITCTWHCGSFITRTCRRPNLAHCLVIVLIWCFASSLSYRENLNDITTVTTETRGMANRV
jgi:hypothetical protein